MSRAFQDEVGTVLDDRSYCLALEPSAGLVGRALRVCARTIMEDMSWSDLVVPFCRGLCVESVDGAFEIGERP